MKMSVLQDSIQKTVNHELEQGNTCALCLTGNKKLVKAGSAHAWKQEKRYKKKIQK